jgi:hypothetical protein
MKRVIISLVSLVLSTSGAHAVPTGCFVADGSGYCYSGYFSGSDCDQLNMTSYFFGNYVSSMCQYVNTAEGFITACAQELSSCDSNKNACLATAAAIEQNRQEWMAYAQRRDALIKRLNKACGSKCRRIK